LPEVRGELLRIARAEERTLSQIVAMMIEVELGRRAQKTILVGSHIEEIDRGEIEEKKIVRPAEAD
jgi:hypothetical protein